jgi:hypothetical protein
MGKGRGDADRLVGTETRAKRMRGLNRLMVPDGPAKDAGALLLWGASSLLAIATAGTHTVPLIVAAVGCVLVIFMRGLPGFARFTLCCCFAPVALAATAPTIAWVAAAVAAATVTVLIRPVHMRAPEEHLLHHLARARRRGEPVVVMVLRIARGAAPAEPLMRTLRVTDSAHLLRGMEADEIHAVMDAADLEPVALERRLRIAHGGGSALTFGWAMFPEDGGSLEALVERASSRVSAGESVPGVIGRIGERSPSMVKVD